MGLLLISGWAVWELVSRRAETKLRRSFTEGVGRSTYLLVRGGRSRYYFDIDGFLTERVNVELIGSWFREIIEAENERGDPIQCLAFIEKREGPVGAIALKEFLSEKVALPSITVRLRKRVLGLSFKAYPQWLEVLKSDVRLLVVSDVATTGGTLQDAIDKIRRAGGRVDMAAVIHDREETDKAGVSTIAKLRAAGITMERFSTRSTFVQFFGQDLSGLRKSATAA